jgi:hypothetical protein
MPSKSGSAPLWLAKILHLFAKPQDKADPPAQADDASTSAPADLCCSGKVNIAYRGVSDDRLYMAYSRHWNEVRFFKPHGLRVFCLDCRRRLL